MEVLVLVDFEGQFSDELKISVGDVVRQVQPGPEEGWLQGELGGRVGLFPQQFVQEIPPSLRADGTQRYPRSLRSARAGKLQPTGKRQRWCRVTFPYAPAKEDELALSPGELVQILEEIEDGWWLGKKNGHLGAFPSNFVQELSGPNPDVLFMEPKVGVGKKRPKMTDETFLLSDPQEEKEREKVAPPMTVPVSSSPQAPQDLSGHVPCYCRAMFDYEPEHEDELVLRKGDLILLLSKETVDVGWWQGESHGKRGLFPDNFVMPLTTVEPGIKSKVPARKTHSEAHPSLMKHILAYFDKATKAEKKPPSQGSQGEASHSGGHKETKEQKRGDTPKLTPTPVKKAAPPPPPPPPPPPAVPAKAKPAPVLPPKSSTIPVSSAGRGKVKEMETNTLDAVLVPSAKLSHPTTGRPKMPGKRPPSQLTASALDEREPAHPLSPTEKAKSSEMVKQSSFPSREEPDATQTEDWLTSQEDLKADLQSLKTVVDLMRVQHRQEMEELRGQLSHEQSQRAALQADIEWLKETLPRQETLDQACQKPTIGGRAMELGALGLSSPTPDALSTVAVKK